MVKTIWLFANAENFHFWYYYFFTNGISGNGKGGLLISILLIFKFKIQIHYDSVYR